MSSPAAVLADAAFGACPGLAPLPPAPAAAALWHRAVALGGQGRHAAAAAALERLRRVAADPVTASLAASTQASLWRQLGGHGDAAALDGRALALLAGVPGEEAAVARADALTGLAADALGGPAPGSAPRLLAAAQRAVAEAGDGAVGWPAARVAVRLGWVRAETALRLDDPASAVDHARAARGLAAAGPSVRHRVKSDLVLAAALAAGRPEEASARAEDARVQSERHGLSPLCWAASLLLGALVPRLSTADAERVAQSARDSATRSAWIITQRGGLLREARRGRASSDRAGERQDRT